MDLTSCTEYRVYRGYRTICEVRYSPVFHFPPGSLCRSLEQGPSVDGLKFIIEWELRASRPRVLGESFPTELCVTVMA